MAESQNRHIVLKIYEDFSQGNIPEILNTFSDDIEFTFQGPDGIPIKKAYHGRGDAEKFFQTLGESLEVQDFSTESIIASGDKVVVLGHERMKVKSTGKVYATQWAHVWTLNKGQVTEFFEYTDSAAIAEAFRAG